MLFNSFYLYQDINFDRSFKEFYPKPRVSKQERIQVYTSEVNQYLSNYAMHSVYVSKQQTVIAIWFVFPSLIKDHIHVTSFI